MSRRSKRALPAALVCLVVLAYGASGLGFAGAPPASASTESDGDITFDVKVDGTSLADTSANSRLKLHDDDSAATIVVTNHGARPVTIHAVQLDGTVGGLVFFGYLSLIDLEVPPGGSVERNFDFDLGGITSQATGAMPGRITLIDSGGEAVASTTFHLDVRGSLYSVYGLFGLVVALITVMLCVSNYLALTTGTLPENRWRRASRFAVCGFGVGVTMTYVAAVARFVTPTNVTLLVVVGLCTVAGVAVGYATPTPGDGDGVGDDCDDDDGDPVGTPDASTGEHSP